MTSKSAVWGKGGGNWDLAEYKNRRRLSFGCGGGVPVQGAESTLLCCLVIG